MAIFKRILSSTPNRKNSSSAASFFDSSENASELETGPDLSSLCWYPYKNLSRDMLRLVVFSGQGGRLIYDSETVVSIKDKVVVGARRSTCGQFQYLPHSTDAPQISKMLFGSMGTSLKADSLKIHTLVNTDSLMISRLFSVPKANKSSSPIRDQNNCMAGSMSSDSDSQSHYSTIRSLDAIRDMQRGSLKTSSYSNTDPPEGFARLRNSSLQLDGGGDALFEELRTFSPNRLSRARRRQLSLKGLCEDGSSLLIGNRSRISSCSSINENIHMAGGNGGEKTRQYGFAIMFPGEDKDFVFQHIIQIEKEILKLVTQIHKAIVTNTKFIPLVYEGWTEFCASICLLHNALRLKTPAWLSLTNPSLQESTATEFCQTLARLSDQLNTKNTKFFLSTLLSSVLMNHLAWVASVAPPENCSYDRSLLLGTSVIDGRRNPYNAMMAQFLELSGGVGIGNRFAKTLILGDNSRLIAEILFVLSYFIRCSSVESKRNEIMTPESLSPLKSLAEDNPIDSAWQGKHFMPSSGERKEAINGLHSMKTFSPPTTIITVPSNGVTESMDTICSSYDRNVESLTPPPNKTRALAVTPAKRAFLPKQDSSTSQRHYELTLDLKELPSFGDAKHSHNGKSPSNCMLESPMQSSSEMNLYSGSSIERSPSTDFGRSLLAGVCTDYSVHFVLSGVDKRKTSLEDMYAAIHEDIKHPTGEPCSSANRQLLSPSTSTIVGLSLGSDAGPSYQGNNGFASAAIDHSFDANSAAPPTIVSSHRSSHESTVAHNKPDEKLRAVIVLADCADYVVKIVSSENCQIKDTEVVCPSEAIASMLEEFVELYKHGCASTFLISFIEDRLGSLLAKSNVLVQLVSSSSTDEKLCGNLTTTSKNVCQNRTLQEVDMKTEEMDNGGTGSLSDSSISGIACNYNSLPQQPDQPSICNREEEDKNNEIISTDHVSNILGCHCSDLRLILNVAAVYSPIVLSSVV